MNARTAMTLLLLLTLPALARAEVMSLQGNQYQQRQNGCWQVPRDHLHQHGERGCHPLEYPVRYQGAG
ncbi:hypothetical protein ACLHZ0_04415 [Aeromonas salmonicida]|uniref:hypothetical protein n=1 Tax=Aeromonas salmonicida TaxID=645 RepID=UPI003D094F29